MVGPQEASRIISESLYYIGTGNADLWVQKLITLVGQFCMVVQSIGPLGEVLWCGMRNMQRITGFIQGATLLRDWS